MKCKFSKKQTSPTVEVKIGEHFISQITEFRYLGSTIQNNGKIDKDINHRSQAKVGVTPIVEKIIESRHKRPLEIPVKRVDQTDVSEIPRRRVKPRKTVDEMTKKDLKINAL
ncbi:hypothetical protein Lal_00019717 [Lupinus albus]|nr:hypothetical protein Lal_00019717 [Lupinus albus]